MNIPTRPLTYPARPVNGGPLPQAAPKLGKWRYEPKINGWRALVHVPSATMFNRHGEQLSITAEFKVALARLQQRPGPFDWLDCEALERRHNLGRGSLFIFDGIAVGMTYEQRKKALETWLFDGDSPAPRRPIGDVLPIWLPPDPDTLYYNPGCINNPGAPQFDPLQFYRALQEANERLGCIFYEGVVVKKADSIYPIQLTDPEQSFPHWVKHRFIP